jgi:DNA excision repair protein ERCC-2
MDEKILKELLFPHKEVRKIQDELIKEVDSCIKNKQNLIVHAPTGLGKSAATLPIALARAIKNNLTVFFLTSRHTQHMIALETLKQIKKKYEKEIIAVDIIGKKWMCPIPGTDELYSYEFFEFCKNMRSDNKCEFCVNSRKKSGRPTIEAQKAVDDLKKLSPCHCEDLVEYCIKEKLCPYEISTLLAKEASVIISDYYYIFSPTIRETFFNKTEKELSNCIIIIDEGHNLPKRVRELLSQNISSFSIRAALKEARKYGYEETAEYLAAMREIFDDYKDKSVEAGQQKLGEKEFFGVENERLMSKEEFINKIKLIDDYQNIIANFEFTAKEIREKQRKSYIGGIANFLIKWEGPDKGFARILSFKEFKDRPNIILSYKCLDPSLLSKEIVNQTYSTIIMSGTLTPTSMYKEILGFENVIEKEYGSPFPHENRLSMIIPDTTTKFTARNPEQYQKIALNVSRIVNAVPGNSAVFFPSYRLRDDINRYFCSLCKKTTFLEMPGMSKIEKQDLLEKFKSYKDTGAVLLGVAAANFAEGIDLPGDLLKAVVVVGLPLQKPDLETKELIDYYEEKYKKGWDYGYIFPAITKCLQSAGRCIRSETDKGIIVFLDQRFVWPRYKKCFPLDLNIKITKLYEDRIKEFFTKNT